jgi:Ca2+-binding EF-hand superfamily protein
MFRPMLAVAIGLITAAGASAQWNPSAIELALFGPERPVRVRLHVTLDGRPLVQGWRTHVENWFRFLDRDGDNILSENELNFAPPPPAMLQGMRQGNIVYATGLGIPADNFGDKRSATLAEFADYYLASGAGPVSSVQGSNSADPLSQALFNRLDLDKDGKLSRAELDASSRTLRQLDLDDDDTVSTAELAPNRNFNGEVVFDARVQVTAQQPAINLVILGSKSSSQVVFTRYDRNKDGKLEPAEFTVDAKVFAQLDGDDNGSLSREELDAWATMAPEAEWTTAWALPSGAARVSQKGGTANRLSLTEMDIQFIPLARPGGTRASPAQYLLKLFRAGDASGRGFVERDDLKAREVQVLGQMFAFLDRDGNGKLTEKEVQALVDLQSEALSCHISVSFSEQGRGLFALLDADRDGRLSPRELRTAWSRLEARDRDKDVAIAPTEIPHQCTFTAGLGFQALTFRPGSNPIAIGGPSYPPGTPAWFMKMDINADGEVSRREFLGAEADFRRFDANADGVLSAEEAMQARKQ